MLRQGHGNGRGVPRVEIAPADEMAPGIPAPAPPRTVPLEFRPDGRIATSETARELGRLGGLATARRVRLVDSLGLSKLAEDSAFAPYRNAAEAFVEHHLAELAESAGGKVGAGASTMVSSAALQLAGSRYAFDKFAESADGSWMKLGSQLADASRQNLLAAWELSTREAKARAESGPRVDPLGYLPYPPDGSSTKDPEGGK